MAADLLLCQAKPANNAQISLIIDIEIYDLGFGKTCVTNTIHIESPLISGRLV